MLPRHRPPALPTSPRRNMQSPPTPSPVGRALGRVHQLVSQALGNGLDVAESSLAGAGGDQVDGLRARVANTWGEMGQGGGALEAS